MPRQLPSKIVRQFRGISQYKNIVNVPMDHALNLLNVFISMSGHLEKFRVPFALTSGPPNFPVAGPQNQIDTFFDYQKADGTRQLVFNAGPCIGYYVANVNAQGVEIIPFVFNVIEDNVANDNARWSWIESNNVLYGADGKVMRKWTGSKWQQMGIGTQGQSPPAPTIGVTIPLSTIQRTGGNVVAAITGTVPTANIAQGWDPEQLVYIGLAGLPFTISGVVGNPAFNGNYTGAGINSNFEVQYAQAGANSGPFNNDGNITIYYIVQAEPTFSTGYDITQISRAGGVSTIVYGGQHNVLVGEQFTLSGGTGVAATFNGTWVCTGNPLLFSLQFNQPGLPDVAAVAPTGPLQLSNGITDIVSGRTWRYAYANSVSGLVGPASLPSTTMPTIPAGGLLANIRAYLTAPAPTDPQIDTIYWFGIEDGGSDYGLVLSAPITPGQPQILGDAKVDSLIDLTQLAPLINFAPPIGSKLAKFQGRLFLAGIVGAPQDIMYSAYEQVLVGTRPEECWFPNNRLRLALGADDIRGFGVILPGVVAFSHSNQMFMFQGQVEDVTTTLPLNFSAQMTELPWATGATSHQAIQSTPYGIVWVAADLTVKIWNGIFYGTIIGPRDLSENIYPLMRRITPGTQSTIQSFFFNWVERDWFGINLCLDGATSPNYLVFFDLSQDANDNLGVFIGNPEVPIDSCGVREDNNGFRHLLLSSGGTIFELMAESQATNGIIPNQTQTNAQLVAYWESGYAGNDTPMAMKMFKYGRILADQSGFNLITKLVDDDGYTFEAPLSKLLSIDGSKFTINQRARHANITIMFPSTDISAAVQQLALSWKVGGEY